MRVEFENHKGTFCWIRDTVFCQEGKCSNCEIYHREKLCPTCEAHLEYWAEMMGERHSCNYQKDTNRDYIKELNLDEIRLGNECGR